MKKMYYTEGPLIMGCGVAGEFRIGEPREVSDDLAEILLKKGRLKEFKAEVTPVAAHASTRRPKAAEKEE